MPKRLLSLTFLILFLISVGCAGRTKYPVFPIPSANVAMKMDKLAAEDRECWDWLSKLRLLCIQLGTCEKE